MLDDERADRLDGHVGREQEEADRHDPLRGSFRAIRRDAGGGEPPYDDDAGQRLDGGIEAVANERDRAGEDAGREGRHSFEPEPRKRGPGEEAGSAGEGHPHRVVESQFNRRHAAKGVRSITRYDGQSGHETTSLSRASQSARNRGRPYRARAACLRTARNHRSG